MAFRIKGANAILESLVNWVASRTDKLTDFNVGSATRTLLESVALQGEEFYYDLKKGIEHAIANSCYNAFSFERKETERAEGYVTIIYESVLIEDVIIPKGTRFSTGNKRLKKEYYTSLDNIKVKAGSRTATIKVVAEEAGARGNALAGEICKIEAGTPNIANVVNLKDLVSGKDIESEADRSQRFKEYIHTLQRGTSESLAYGIKQVPGVAGVYIDDNYIGYVRAFVHDKNGDLSEDLKTNIYKEIDKYRAGGIEVEIRPTVKKLVNIDNIKVIYKDGINKELYDSIIETSIIGYLDNMQVSESLKFSNLLTYIYESFREAISFIDIENLKDVNIKSNEIVRAGEIAVNKSIEKDKK